MINGQPSESRPRKVSTVCHQSRVSHERASRARAYTSRSCTKVTFYHENDPKWVQFFHTLVFYSPRLNPSSLLLWFASGSSYNAPTACWHHSMPNPSAPPPLASPRPSLGWGRCRDATADACNDGGRSRLSLLRAICTAWPPPAPTALRRAHPSQPCRVF